MSTTRQTTRAALHARLQPLAALVLRDEVLPERIPAAGLIILRDGQPGQPEVTLSPLRHHYQHRAEPEVVVQTGTVQAGAFDDLSAAIGTALSRGDLTIRCPPVAVPRRGQLERGGDVPLAENVEAYEVEILHGAAVKSTLSTNTASVLYTAAQQIPDWGALLDPGDSLDIRICQLSGLIGRGAARSATLSF